MRSVRSSSDVLSVTCVLPLWYNCNHLCFRCITVSSFWRATICLRISVIRSFHRRCSILACLHLTTWLSRLMLFLLNFARRDSSSNKCACCIATLLLTTKSKRFLKRCRRRVRGPFLEVPFMGDACCYAMAIIVREIRRSFSVYSSTCLGRPPSWAATCSVRTLCQYPDIFQG